MDESYIIEKVQEVKGVNFFCGVSESDLYEILRVMSGWYIQMVVKKSLPTGKYIDGVEQTTNMYKAGKNIRSTRLIE